MRRSKLFTEDYTRWVRLSKQSPTLAHKSHRPDPKHYGLDDWEASKIMEMVDRDMNRETA